MTWAEQKLRDRVERRRANGFEDLHVSVVDLQALLVEIDTLREHARAWGKHAGNLERRLKEG